MCISYPDMMAIVLQDLTASGAVIPTETTKNIIDMAKKEPLNNAEWNLLRLLEEEVYTMTNEQKNWPTKTWLRKRIQELKQRAGEDPSS